jgi:prepilin-type processing-associated H-X9-DG protein
VVVGIIGLLIAILLPSLGVARQMAQRTVCAAKLEQIIAAAQIHAIDHQGFYPIAGYIGTTDPADDGDTYAVHYDYFPYTAMRATRLLAPITMALATEMSYRYVLDSTNDATQGADETDNKGFIRHFLCPSQATSVDGLNFGGLLPMLYIGSYPGGWTVWYTEGQSYIFNEAIVGVDPGMGRCAGKQSLVHRAAESMFAADGLGGATYNWQRRSSYILYQTGIPMFTVYNNVNAPPVTLGDALTARQVAGSPVAGDPENFDRLRHRGKINIAFCDGHVETRTISSKDLATVYILAP